MNLQYPRYASNTIAIPSQSAICSLPLPAQGNLFPAALCSSSRTTSSSFASSALGLLQNRTGEKRTAVITELHEEGMCLQTSSARSFVSMGNTQRRKHSPEEPQGRKTKDRAPCWTGRHLLLGRQEEERGSVWRRLWEQETPCCACVSVCPWLHC